MCGDVTYDVAGPPMVVARCHCDECRRLSGTGHTVGAMFAAKTFVLCGEIGKFSYSSTTGSQVTKAFCIACGSPIFGCNTHMPDYLTVPLGTMENAQDLRVEVVIFARDKPHWDEQSIDVMSFDTQPDWQPGQ